MKRSGMISIPVAAGALALGLGLGVSAVNAVAASHARTATHVQPDKKTCNKSTACKSYTNTGSGAGIEGTGVYYGVEGVSTLSAPSGESSYTNSGLYGYATGALGAYAFSADEGANWFENDNSSYYTTFSEADNSGYPLGTYSVVGSSAYRFYIDPYADGFFDGYVEATDFYTDLRMRDGHKVGAFGSRSTREQIEDVGSARLVNGHADVRIDEALAKVIDMRSGYQVFLTPGGDSRGLYVASKAPGGFEVRESMGGRSTLSFDYRIVAHPIGTSDARLPLLRDRKSNPSLPKNHIPE